METIDILYLGVPMTVEYQAEFDTDYGVDNSPVWDDVTINSVKVGGVEIWEMLTADQVEEIGEVILGEIK